jgi:RNA polymerase sigma factor (sigma-70 family)
MFARPTVSEATTAISGGSFAGAKESCTSSHDEVFPWINAKSGAGESAIVFRRVVTTFCPCDRLRGNLTEISGMTESLDDILIVRLAKWSDEQKTAIVYAIKTLQTTIGEELAAFALKFIENPTTNRAEDVRAFLAASPANAEARSLISFLIRESYEWQLAPLNGPDPDLDTWMARQIFSNDSQQWTRSERALIAMWLVSFHAAKLKAVTDRGFAEDVLSKVLIGIIEGRGSYSYNVNTGQTPVAAFIRYIWRSIANGGVDFVRTALRDNQAITRIVSDSEVLGGFQSGSEAVPEEILLNAEEKQEADRLVHAAIEALSPESREVVLRRCFLEQSYSKIAADCGESETALRKRYSRALAELRELLRGPSGTTLI